MVGREEVRTSDGKLLSVNCDGIALSPDNNWLYFEATTNGRLYRVATADLRNEKLSEEALRGKLQQVATIGAADGFWGSPDGVIYFGSPADHSVKWFAPDRPEPVGVADDDARLVWPDSLALSTDGWMYVSASQLHRMARFHNGENQTQLPYQIFRFRIPTAP